MNEWVSKGKESLDRGKASYVKRKEPDGTRKKLFVKRTQSSVETKESSGKREEYHQKL